MSSNPNISTISATDNAGDEKNARITNILSVKLKASKFQKTSNKDHGDLPPLTTKSEISTAPSSNTYRSLYKGLEDSSNRNVNATLNIGSDRLNQKVPSPLRTGDKHYQKHSPYHGNGMAEMKAKENTDDFTGIECSSTDDDDDDDQDTEDSTESLNNRNSSITNNNDRPKPGRLDLRQFDNITSAIARLNVQPPLKAHSHRSPIIPATTSKTLSSSPWKSTKHTDNLDLSRRNLQGLPLDEPIPCVTTTARRPMQNPLKNHGRPVAPPRLPAGLVVSSSAPSSSVVSSTSTKPPSVIKRLGNVDLEVKSSKATIANVNMRPTKGTTSEESVIDFSQSPIAQRLLRHSKDHKGKHLSPYIFAWSCNLIYL